MDSVDIAGFGEDFDMTRLENIRKVRPNAAKLCPIMETRHNSIFTNSSLQNVSIKKDLKKQKINSNWSLSKELK